MPQMGFEMIEGTVVAWLRHEGDTVSEGEVIAEVETDKAIVELEAPASGTLLSVDAREGESVAVGAAIAYIGGPEEHVPRVRRRTPPELRDSSVAQRLAAEHGLDISTIEGTGPGGRVTKDDVLGVMPSAATVGGLRTGFPPRLPDTDGRIVLGPMGEAIARRTEATMRDVPHFYETMRIDMTAALDFRRNLNRTLDGESKVSVNDLVIRACVLTLLKYPVFNATYEGGHLQVQPHINIGLAVAMPYGLMVPAIEACEAKTLPEIARAAKDVVSRAKDGKLRQVEYTGTFSISNLGMYGIDSFTIVIVRPQVAVLGVPAIKPTPVVIGKDVVVRQTMVATVGCDHRAIQGAEAAQFLVELKRLLEEPRLLGD
jgi:pyruvate dehydrogenase E2 component (dihydrolipoamide acetyltransferase)